MTTPPTQPTITKVTFVQDDFYRLTLFPCGEGEVSYPMTREQLFSLMNQIFEHWCSFPASELTVGQVVSLVNESSTASNGNVVTYVKGGEV